MADRLKSDGGATAPSGRGSAGAMPRWVQVFGIIGAVLIGLFVVLHVSGHGFDHHMRMPVPAHGAPPP